MKYDKITISGKICTGKSTLFRTLQNKLGWPTISSGAYFREYAKKHGLDLNNADEQTKNITLKVDSKVQKFLGKKGNLLVDAWLGGILAEGIPHVLKVLLISNDNDRFKRFSKREHVSFAVAKKEVMKRDTEWFEKVSAIHKRSDFFNPKYYNLVIDTYSCDPMETVGKVLDKLGYHNGKH